VDEPDVVKTDGDRIYAVARGRLFVIDARAPKLLGSLDLGEGSGHELLLRGHRLLVVLPPSLGRARSRCRWRALPLRPAPPWRPTSLPPRRRSSTWTWAILRPPKVRSTLTVDGDYVAARLNGAIARVVVSSSPDAVLEPQDARRVTGWLPRAVLAKAGGGPCAGRRTAAPCAARRPSPGWECSPS